MTIEGLTGLLYGYLFGLSHVIVIIVYFRLRERLARLEWRFPLKPEKIEKKEKRTRTPKEA